MLQDGSPRHRRLPTEFYLTRNIILHIVLSLFNLISLVYTVLIVLTILQKLGSHIPSFIPNGVAEVVFRLQFTFLII